MIINDLTIRAMTPAVRPFPQLIITEASPQWTRSFQALRNCGQTCDPVQVAHDSNVTILPLQPFAWTNISTAGDHPIVNYSADVEEWGKDHQRERLGREFPKENSQ